VRWTIAVNISIPPTKDEVNVLPVFICLFVCLSVSKNACMDLDEMLRVDRCRDMDELRVYFSTRSTRKKWNRSKNLHVKNNGEG